MTVTAGEGGVPAGTTDILLVNGNSSAALTGINKVMASATVHVTKNDQPSLPRISAIPTA